LDAAENATAKARRKTRRRESSMVDYQAWQPQKNNSDRRPADNKIALFFASSFALFAVAFCEALLRTVV
jgi:hypothetical protein